MTAPEPPEALTPALLHAFAVELRRTLGLVFPSTRAEAFRHSLSRRPIGATWYLGARHAPQARQQRNR